MILTSHSVNQVMATLETGSTKLQEYASIAVPGEWITDDDAMEPTTCKIGGRSNVFELRHRSLEQVDCGQCKKDMFLLVQMNAPMVDEMYERTVYLFMCSNPKCTKSDKGWKVMACRGPKVTHFAHHQSAKRKVQEEEADIFKLIKSNNKTTTKGSVSRNIMNNADSFWNRNLSDAVTVDAVDEKEQEIKSKLDGLNDDFSRLMAMQSRLMKQVDDQSLQQRQSQKSKPPQKVQSKVRNDGRFREGIRKRTASKGQFVPFELVFEDEMYYEKAITWNDRNVDLKQFMDSKQDEEGNGDDDAKSDDEQDEEELFTDYLERIRLERTQCVRYCYGAEPLIPHKIETAKVPQCEHCGKRKVFEFQAMSVILNYLQPKQINHEWLTALVYVCPVTCQTVDFHHVIVCCEP